MSEPAAALVAAEPPAAKAADSHGGRAVARHSMVITGIGIIGKVVAVLRDAVIGRAFGTTAGMDALFAALSIPTTFANLVTGGGLRVTFQAELARRQAQDEASARRLATFVTAAVSITTALMALGMALLAGPYAAWLSPGDGELATMLRLVSPMLLLLSLLGTYTSMLHARLLFRWPALEAVIRNATIALIVPIGMGLGVRSVALGHLVGTALVVVCCAAAAHRAGWTFALPGAEERRVFGRILVVSVPAILGGSIYPLYAVIDRAMALTLGPGAASALAYADPLWQTGMIVAGPVGTVALSVLSDLAARNDRHGFATTVTSTVRGTLFLTAPLTALLVALAHPAVQLLYQRGKFDAHAAEMTAQAVVFLALCLPTTAAQGVTMRALQAEHRFAATGRIAVVVVALHTLANWPLMHWMGHRGIALSSALSGLALVWMLDRELRLPAPGRWAFLLKLSLASVASWGAALAVSHAIPPMAPLARTLLQLALGSAAGLVAFAAVAHVAKMDELQQARRFLLRRRV